MNILKRVYRGGLGISPAAVLLGFLKGPGKAYRVLSSTLQAFDRETSRRMDLWDFSRAFSAEDEIKLHAGQWMDGSITALERYVMALLVKHFRPKTILELGTFRGTSTRVILDNMEEAARVYTVDLPIETPPTVPGEFTDERLIRHRGIGEDFLDHHLASRVEQIYGNTFDAGTWEKIPAGVDFAFVDASHSYKAVKNDTEKLWLKLKSNAVVLWHDYSEGHTPERGVGKYLRELMRSRDDIFVCDQTSLGIRIPKEFLLGAEGRVQSFFTGGSYIARQPGGVTPWLSV